MKGEKSSMVPGVARRLILAILGPVSVLLIAAGCGGEGSSDPGKNATGIRVQVADDPDGPDHSEILRKIGDANEASEPAFNDLLAAGKSGDIPALESALVEVQKHLARQRTLIDRISRDDLKEAVLSTWEPSNGVAEAYAAALDAGQAGDQQGYKKARADLAKAMLAVRATLNSDQFEGVEMTQDEIDAYSGR